MFDFRKPDFFRSAARPVRTLAGGALLACAAAVGIQSALAQVGPPSGASAPAERQERQHGEHHKHHRHGAHGGHGTDGGGMMFGASPRHMSRMLDAVNATEAQRTEIQRIVAAAAPGMKTLREQGRTLREQARQVLTAQTIDTNVAEQLRLQMLAHHDAVSKQGLATMLAVAQQLTPEQRVKIGEMMAQRKAQKEQRRDRHQRQPGVPAAPNS